MACNADSSGKCKTGTGSVFHATELLPFKPANKYQTQHLTNLSPQISKCRCVTFEAEKRDRDNGMKGIIAESEIAVAAAAAATAATAVARIITVVVVCGGDRA